MEEIAEEVKVLDLDLWNLLYGQTMVQEMTVQCDTCKVTTAITVAPQERHRRRPWVWAIVVGLLVVGLSVAVTSFERDRRNAEAARHAALWVALGEWRLLANDDAGARDAFTEAIAVCPTPRTYLSRCFANWRLCNLQAALDDSTSAFRLDPNNMAAIRTRQTVFAAMR